MGKQRATDDAPEGVKRADSANSAAAMQPPEQSELLEEGSPEAVAKLSFEHALKALEGLVEQMEDGDLSLEEAVRNYERGVVLHQHCQRALDAAEQKVQILTEQSAEGKLEPFVTAKRETTGDES